MKVFLLIFSSLVIYSCVRKNNISNIHIKEISNTEYIFCLKYVKMDSTDIIVLKKIEIKDIYTKKINQIINLDAIEVPRIDIDVTEDVNFDGYNDIKILNYVGAYNSCYSFWLYNNLTNNFDHFKELDKINNPIILKGKKEICSKYRIGLSEFHFEKYFWSNDTIVLKEKYEEFWAEKGILKTTKLIDKNYIHKDSIILDRFVEARKCE